MCIVIDVHVIPALFDPTHCRHTCFRPVLDWIYSTRGAAIVYGGTKYKHELSHLRRYLGFLAELRKSRKLVLVRDDMVDLEAERVAAIVGAPGFDDEHLVGIVIVSGIQLLCSDDKAADKYIKRADLYPKGTHMPRIYRAASHARLLEPKCVVAVRNQA
jgi:hypothetical protein